MPLSICDWLSGRVVSTMMAALELHRRHVLLCGSMYSTDQMVLTILYKQFT